MPLFSETNEFELTNAYESTKRSMTVCEFDYFSSVATEHYYTRICNNKHDLLSQLMNQAKMVCAKPIIRVPIDIVQTINPYYKKPIIGHTFTSPSGLHTRCLYDIYRNSDFRYRMNYLLSNSNRFFVTLDFNLEDNGSEMRHTCTLWLNYRISGNIPDTVKKFNTEKDII